MKYSARWDRRAAICGLLAFGCFVPSQLRAAAPDRGAQPPAGESDFARTMAELVAREKVVVVTEDAPFRTDLTQKQAEALRTGLRSEKAEERYRAVAEAFDYECRQEGNAMFFSKRFSDIQDLPFVTYEEVRAALDHLDRALTPLTPPSPVIGLSGRPFFRFLDALSDEQIAFLKEPKPVSALTPEQQRLLQAVCAREYMEPFSTLSRVNTWYIKQLTRSDTVFRWVQTVPDTPRILVLDGPLGYNGLRVQKGLSHGFRFGSGGPSGL